MSALLARIADLHERASLMRSCGYLASASALEERLWALMERAHREGVL